jgi:iron(III) transport system ATP-binding protein
MTMLLELNAVRLAIGTNCPEHRKSRPDANGSNLTLERGEIGCMTGDLGAGKTRLLRAIAGFESLHGGTIAINGAVVASGSMALPPYRRRIGMMVQDDTLFPDRSVARNVALALGALGGDQQGPRAMEVLAQVGMADLAEALPEALTPAQVQRVLLARAMAPSPELLLLDEPFAPLDADAREAFAQDLRRILKASSQTALVATGEPMPLFAFADRVGVMADGLVVRWDTPAAANGPQTSEPNGAVH